jgi:hypothetical protein
VREKQKVVQRRCGPPAAYIDAARAGVACLWVWRGPRPASRCALRDHAAAALPCQKKQTHFRRFRSHTMKNATKETDIRQITTKREYKNLVRTVSRNAYGVEQPNIRA